jgi:probable DNA metabolism protein
VVAHQSLNSWWDAANDAIRRGLTPDRFLWRPETASASLFEPATVDGALDHPMASTLFVRLAKSVSCHRDPAKWDALYAVLWRMNHGEPELLSVITDPAVYRLVQMHRNVKRAAHKMKAFVRFRRIEVADADAYVAWFEPAHLVVERTAPFFARRFASMRWSILTPDRCAHWDLKRLTFTDGVDRSAAPTDDSLEDLWRTYYASVFNPARLNGRAMRAEMPRRYWSGLPEARIIADLRNDAPRRVHGMLEQLHADPELMPPDLEAVGELRSMSPSSLDTPGAWDPVHDPGVSVARDRSPLPHIGANAGCTSTSSRILFGVAGWTDPTLLAPGVFYPANCTSAEARLRYYASRYSMVEVDATYYSLPSRAMAAAWAARTPDNFVVDIKAHALMTGHPTDVRRLPDWVRRALPRRSSESARIYSRDVPVEILDEVWARFRAALDPLRTAGKLGAIMLQFPRWFEPTTEAADALRRAKRLLGDDLATIEFRNRAWMEGRIAAERTVALLEDLELSYVIVDAPPGMPSSMPRTVAVTDPRLAVFRFHGRRVSTWEAKNDPVTERYRYLYDRAELRAWVPSVLETAFNVARVHMTFNNNHANYATTNSAEMAELIATAG